VNPAPALRLASSAVLLALIAAPLGTRQAQTDPEVRQLVSQEIRRGLPADGIGGFAVVVRYYGHNLFFNHGYADGATKRAVDSESLFNLASIGKVFDVTLLTQMVRQRELDFDDPVVEYVPELQRGSDIRRVTIGQLATHTSGLLLPQDHPPWPEQGYTLPEFIRTMNGWRADAKHQPGKQRIYTHAGFMLLHLAIERRFAMPLARLMAERVLQPLGMISTAVPMAPADPRGALDPVLKKRAVQGFGEDGKLIGEPGDVQGYYLWPGTAQMFSSARDLAVFLAANLGELPHDRLLQEAMDFAQQSRFTVTSQNGQALAWEVLHESEQTIVEKSGGLNNTSIYIGIIKPARVGIVVLANRGNQETIAMGRRILIDLARRQGLG
jgi:beta-lactamase class C